MNLNGLDTETTGISFRHGCRPFFLTTCNEEGEQLYWRWEVDPYTRTPQIPKDHIEEIVEMLSDPDECWVLQNPKFDVHGLLSILPKSFKWDWKRTWDTLIAGHLLGSSKPHDLTNQALIYLGIDIGSYEEELGIEVKKARSMARREFPKWRIAKAGDPHFPTLKSKDGKKTWKNDMWLCRAIAIEKGFPEDHPWYTLPNDYANSDSAVVVPMIKVMLELIQERGLMAIYEERRRLLESVHNMEMCGVTFNQDRLDTLFKQFAKESHHHGTICVNCADDPDFTEVPKGTTNKLKEIVRDHFQLTSDRKTKKGGYCMDKHVMEEWGVTVEHTTKAWHFINNLGKVRARNTAIGYMESYEKFSIDVLGHSEEWRVLFPSFNITGSDTLRFSSSNPNGQNISKREGFNLRQLYGPLPGRAWVSLDYSNLELTIPAYEVGETAIIELLEKPNEAPYYGSFHLLVAHILHPEKFEQCLKEGISFKKKYAATWYQWVKNGNFAVQYGASPTSGTADRAYHVPGGQLIVQEHLRKIERLNQHHINHAQKHGFVWTMKDLELDAAYPVEVRKEYGRIKPTQPLNYHIQGTAMWAMIKAMNRVDDYLGEHNTQCKPGMEINPILQVHDELVLDVPMNERYVVPKVRKVKHLMELSGKDIGIPLRVGVDYHMSTWDKCGSTWGVAV